MKHLFTIIFILMVFFFATYMYSHSVTRDTLVSGQNNKINIINGKVKDNLMASNSDDRESDDKIDYEIRVREVSYKNLNKEKGIDNNHDSIEENDSTREVEDKGNLKILTYNIRHGVGIDGQMDLDRLARVLEKSGADIIGLNEVDVNMKRSAFINQVRYLALKLNMNYAFGASLKNLIGRYGNAILSKYPIKQAENYTLPNQEKAEPRALLRVELELPFPGDIKKVDILSTHLSLNKNERVEQIRWINNYLGDLNVPYVLMGDFNSEINEIDSALKDSRKTDVMEPQLRGIKTYSAIKPEKGIDLFFTSPDIFIRKGYTIKSVASDHLPVYVELKIRV